MSTYTRASLVTGPAKLVRSTGIWFTKEDFEIKLLREIFTISTSAHGEVDKRDKDVMVSAGFIPDGRFNAAARAQLWPYANSVPGDNIFGAADTPLVAHAADGAVHTLIASAVTKMPSIKLSAIAAKCGAMEIMGLRANNMDWDDASSLYTIGAGSTFVDSGFSPSIIKTQAYSAAWGTVAGFTAFEGQDGFDIEFNLQLGEIAVDSLGILLKTVKSLDIMVKCIPVGPTSAQILAALAMQDVGAARGRSLGSSSVPTGRGNLVITGADAVDVITLNQVNLVAGGFRFGASVLRQGEVGFVATRTFTAGVQQALFTLSGPA